MNNRRPQAMPLPSFPLRFLPGFICLLILLAPTAGFAQIPAAEREQALRAARAHADAKRFDEAKQIYQRLADGNPRDFEARVWVARLESWQDHYPRAEELYRQLLADDPGNVEAQLGLVDVFSWQSRFDEAMPLLDQLLAARPDDVEVLVRLGRLHRWQRHKKEALDYYRRVQALDPGNRAARDAIDSLTSDKTFRLETGYLFEEFNFTGNTNGNILQLAYLGTENLTVVGGLHYQNKFGQNNTRYNLGATYRFPTRTWLHGEFGVSPPGDTVIANQDYTFDITQVVGSYLAVGGGYRFANYKGADVQIITIMVNVDPRPTLHLTFHYTPAYTKFSASGRTAWNQNGRVRLTWDVNQKFSPYVQLAAGSESFEGASTIRLGSFSAQTWAAGVLIHPTPNTGIRIGYYFQNRTLDRHQQGIGLSYYFGF